MSEAAGAAGGGVRFRVSHRTVYRYSETVTLSQNLAHLAPRAVARQRVLAHRLEIDPVPTAVRRRLDYFGNPADAFAIAIPHQTLAVLSACELALHPASWPEPEATPAWDDAAVRGGGDAVEAWEFRFDSAQAPCAAELLAYAAPDFPPGRPVLAAAVAFAERIRREFAYDPGATTVATPVLEALELRRGVCQDFAQVMIGGLRSLGLAARYASGYLETRPPPGRPRLVGADATHAWVQLWCGPAGWVDLDPTNACLASDHHLLVAVGRDFADVSPLKGMVLGGGRAVVSVAVDVERLG